MSDTKDNSWCVYKHTSPSGKCYIGMTKQKPEYRWNNGKGYCSQIVFYRAIQKYGWANFTREILADSLTLTQAVEKEKEMIQKYNSKLPNGYNAADGGIGSNGYIHTPEQNRAKSIRQTGIKRGPMSQEQKDKISASKTGIPNPHTKEHIEKIAAANRGKKRTAEQIERMKKNRKPFKQSEESKRKISETCKQINTAQYFNKPEIREKMLQKRRIGVELYDDAGNTTIQFKSMTDCAKYLNVSIALINKVLNGKCVKNKYNIRRIKK